MLILGLSPPVGPGLLSVPLLAPSCAPHCAPAPPPAARVAEQREIGTSFEGRPIVTHHTAALFAAVAAL